MPCVRVIYAFCATRSMKRSARRYAERMHDWRDFASSLPAGNQLVFSCRKLDYAGELAIQQVEIDALDEDRFKSLPSAIWTMAGSCILAGAESATCDLLELAEIPYYLHMLVDVFEEQGELPPHRAQLFNQFVFQLFDREQSKRHPVAWIEPAAQHLALSELAYAMQELGEGTQVEQDWALGKLPPTVRLPDGTTVETPPADLLALARAASLLAGQGNGTAKFTHHLLQEYFAADALFRPCWRGRGPVLFCGACPPQGGKCRRPRGVSGIHCPARRPPAGNRPRFWPPVSILTCIASSP